MAQVLVVEDDERLAALLVELLAGAGHTASICTRGDEAVTRIRAEEPELVILDIGLPGQDGFSVCRQVRAEYPGRILILTARGDEIDEVVGLELGADDYLAKPVAPRRLLARVGALLRRPALTPTSVLRNGPLIVDPRRRVALLDDTPLELSTAEFQLLHYLIERVGQVVSRDQLYRDLRGFPYDGVDRSMDVRISRVRKTLADGSNDRQWVKTIHGEGYLMPPAE
ncbi:MAG: response regulator transcription factor [Myxococcota bacterium]